MDKVEGRENNKAKKNEKERSKGKKSERSKFWLMHMHQSKILHIFTWKLDQNLTAVWKSTFLANFREILE